MPVQTEGQGLYPAFTTMYSSRLEQLLQQMRSLLRDRVESKFYVGHQASPVTQMTAVKMRQVTGRYQPMGRVDADFIRPWVFPVDYDLPQLIDTFDLLKTIIEPTSEYVMNASSAAGRQWDDTIMAAACAVRMIGVNEGSMTTDNFDTTKYQIAVNFMSSSNSGMTVQKFIELKRLFRHYQNEIEQDPVTVVMGSQQESDMLNQAQVVSSDFRSGEPVLESGKLIKFLGMNIVYSERVPETTIGTTRGVLAWVRSGLHLGIWQDMSNRISIRNDIEGEPFQLYTKMSCGGVRMQPGKVMRVLCADTTGSDITP